MVDTYDIAAPAALPSVAAAPEHTWLARVFSFPAVLLMSLTLAVTLFVTTAGPGRDTTDPDIWWHLANARVLFTTGHFIHRDIFSFTVAGQPWINFEWLGEVPFYAGYKALGFRGIFLASLLLNEAIVLVVYGLCYMRSRDVKASFLASGIAIFFASVSMGPRTLLCGWLCLAVEVAILWAYQQRRDYLWALPPLFVLWINAHGTWLIGFAILLLFAATTLVNGCWGAVQAQSYSPAARNRLFLFAGVTAAALFLNPYGWRLVLYPFDFAVNQQFNLNFVDEWASLNFHEALGRAALVVVVLLGVATLVRRRTWQLFDLLLVLLVVYSGFTYSRFVFMTGIVLAPFAAVELRGLLGPYERELEKPWVNAFAMAVLATIIVWRLPSERLLEQHRQETFPLGALARLQELPAGHTFNTYEWGGFMQFYTPQFPTFVDSRTDIFIQHGVLPQYLNAIKGGDTFETLKNYDIRYALLPPNTAMTALLAHSGEWREDYSDDHSVLFSRVGH